MPDSFFSRTLAKLTEHGPVDSKEDRNRWDFSEKIPSKEALGNQSGHCKGQIQVYRAESVRVRMSCKELKEDTKCSKSTGKSN